MDIAAPNLASDALTEQRGALAERLHLAAALAACAALPIGAASSSITLAILAVVTVLRTPAIWRDCLPLLRMPTVIAAVAFLLWWALALLWSPDVPIALKFMRTSRFFALFLLLWPLRERIGMLVSAVLVGVAFQNLIQVAGFVGLLPAPRWEAWQPNGGLSKHAGHLGNWSAAAVLWHLAAIHALPWACLWRRVVPLGLAALGVAIGAGTSPMLGLVAGVAVLAIVLMMRRDPAERGRRTWPVVACAVGVIVVTAVALPTMRSEIGDSWRLLRTRATDAPQASSLHLRLTWWGAAVRSVADAPLIGAGPGGFRSVAAADGPTLEAESARTYRGSIPFVYHDPHNTALLALAELGLIGLGLLLLWITCAAIQMARDRRRHPTSAASLPVLAVWLVAGSLESLQSSGTLMAMGLFVMAITLPQVDSERQGDPVASPAASSPP